jgi:hypothetical protein
VVLFSAGTAVTNKMPLSQAQLLNDDSSAIDRVVRKQQTLVTMRKMRKATVERHCLLVLCLLARHIVPM